MQHAFIKLVPKSVKESITIEDVKDYFTYYRHITSQTGKQLGWEYAENAFPYEVIQTSDATLHLKSSHDRYRSIYVGVGTEDEQPFVQLTLPETATFGDKGKANEFCRFLAKKLEGELRLFNGRTMYFYKR
ncbi:DUF1885 family protein [Ectobacillus ponti]|uniref:DUF1885 family protein n=1 Tax=Ectobacillus ponti TaxID=2961894 RepID=A0AA41X7F1_9BACI|nr:DUF1885 family protein [Ectobacillus ponti]MCP8970304.1 DUF1885 family protein [Ectobacillus ponti]